MKRQSFCYLKKRIKKKPLNLLNITLNQVSISLKLINYETFFYNKDVTTTANFLNEINEISETNTNNNWLNIFRVPHIRLGLILGIAALQITTSIWTVVFYSTNFLRYVNILSELAELVSSIMLFVRFIFD